MTFMLIILSMAVVGVTSLRAQRQRLSAAARPMR